jgi:twitching motility protein PilT
MPLIDPLCERLIEQEGSDLHLLEGQKPKIRKHGNLTVLDDEPVLDGERIKQMLREICSADRWQHFLGRKDLDFAYALEGKARFRVNYYCQVHGIGAVMRIIPTKILTLQELDTPPVLRQFAELRSGLVLMTGPTGSGKSTTLAAVIDHINRNDARTILTIEEPVEFVHANRKSTFCQREVGEDAKSFGEALRVAARQDCDVILVGEMRDYETISLALSAAGMGTLVFGTLHTNSAVKTVDRIIDAFPSGEQSKARTMLADSLRGICSQFLLKRKDGKGRIAAFEILLGTQGLASSIRDGNNAHIHNIIQAGKNNGMQLMDDAIEAILNRGLISGEEAYMKSHDKERFIMHAPKMAGNGQA